MWNLRRQQIAMDGAAKTNSSRLFSIRDLLDNRERERDIN